MFKNISKKRLAVLLVSLSLLLVVTVGGTLAYVFTASGSLDNIFTPAQVSCAVVENVANSSYSVKNTGNTDAYIRIAIVVNWNNSDTGNVYASAPIEGTNYSLNCDSTWQKGSDGFYYYTAAIEAEALTSEITFEQKTTMDGYFLSVEIVASAIQSKPDTVVESAWLANGVVGDANNGVLTINQGG